MTWEGEHTCERASGNVMTRRTAHHTHLVIVLIVIRHALFPAVIRRRVDGRARSGIGSCCLPPGLGDAGPAEEAFVEPVHGLGHIHISFQEKKGKREEEREKRAYVRKYVLTVKSSGTSRARR